MQKKEPSLQEPLSEKKGGHYYKDNDGFCQFGCGCSVCGDSYKAPDAFTNPYDKCHKNPKSKLKLVVNNT